MGLVGVERRRRTVGPDCERRDHPVNVQHAAPARHTDRRFVQPRLRGRALQAARHHREQRKRLGVGSSRDRGRTDHQAHLKGVPVPSSVGGLVARLESRRKGPAQGQARTGRYPSVHRAPSHAPSHNHVKPTRSQFMTIEVDVQLRHFNADDHVYRLFPGESYRYYTLMQERSCVFLDNPGIGLPDAEGYRKEPSQLEAIFRSERMREAVHKFRDGDYILGLTTRFGFGRIAPSFKGLG